MRLTHLTAAGTAGLLVVGGVLAAAPAVAGSASSSPTVPAATAVVGTPVPTGSASNLRAGRLVTSRAAASTLTAAAGTAATSLKVASVGPEAQVFKQFNGIGEDAAAAFDGNASPSDAVVAAGTKYLVELTNSSETVSLKSGRRVAARGLTTFLLGGPPSSPAFLSDPQLVYDKAKGRWLASAVLIYLDSGGNLTGEATLVVRASKSADPTGAWFAPVGFFTADGQVEDQPRLGITGNKVVLVSEQFDTGLTFVGPRITVIGKPALYAGKTGAQLPAYKIDLDGNTYFGGIPANEFQGTNDGFVVFPGGNELQVLGIEGGAGLGFPPVTHETDLPVPAIDPPSPAQQVAPGKSIDSGDGRLQSAVWRSQRLWLGTTTDCTPFGDSATHDCLRVWRIDTSLMKVLSDETIGYPHVDAFLPSLTVDMAGNLLMGFTVSSPDLPHRAGEPAGSGYGPGFAVAGRSTTAGWTSFPQVVGRWPTSALKGPGVNGVGTQPLRWGDYHAAAMDPSSPYDAWIVNGWANPADTGSGAEGNWGTRIARVSLAKYALTLKASRTSVAKGTTVTFVGRIARPAGPGVSGLPVRLQFKARGATKWSTLVSARSGPGGWVSLRRWVTRSGVWRTSYPGVSNGGATPSGFRIQPASSRAVTVWAR